jgi:hypothetical protein
MSRLFRGKFLSLLKKAYEGDTLRFPGLISHLEQTFTPFLGSLYAQDWVVYCKPPFGGPESVIRYLGRYTHRVALANRRIISMEDGRVAFLWKDYTDNKRKTMALDASEFIRRFLLHVLPDGFVKIRYFGLLANRTRKACLDACREVLGVDEKEEVAETWEEHLLRLTGVDLRECPLCHGKMARRELIPQKRGPP